MNRTATRPKPITAEAAADLLYQRGVGLLAVSSDTGLAQALADVMIRAGLRLGAAPSDYNAVRAELRRLWGESEAVERRALCARYTPEFMRVQ